MTHTDAKLAASLVVGLMLAPLAMAQDARPRGRLPLAERFKRRAQAAAFAKALKAAGVAAEVVDASDRNHGEINAWFGKPGDKVTGKARAFLEALLGRGAAKNL